MVPRPRFHSVRSRFLTGILLAAIPGLVALAASEDRYLAGLLETISVTLFSNDVLDLSESVSDRLAAARLQLASVAHLVGGLPEERGTGRAAGGPGPADLARIRRELAGAFPPGTDFATVNVVDRAGHSVARIAVPGCPQALDSNARLAPAVACFDQDAMVVFPLALGPPGRFGSMTLAIAAPLGGTRRARAALVGVLDPVALFKRVSDAPVSGGRVTFIADGTGRIVAWAKGGSAAAIGDSIPASLPYPPAIARSIVSSGSGLIARGMPFLLAYNALELGTAEDAPAWIVGESMPRRALLANLGEVRRWTLSVLAVILLLSLGLAFLLARQITGPLRRLGAGAERIAGGDLEHALAVETRDEVGETARAFEVMRANLRATLVALQNERRNLEARVSAATAELREQGHQLASANEILRSLDRLKSDFISNVSHELRTPVAVLAGATDLLGDDAGLTPEQRVRLIHMVADGARRLEVLVQQVLEYTSVDAGPSQWVLTDLDVRALIAGLLEDLKPQAAERRIAVDVQVAEGLPLVHGSAETLEIAVSHLVRNAITFTPAGGRVGVSALPALLAGRPAVCVTVEDTGPGMAREDVPWLFERFTQGGSILTEKPRGLGLGLSIAFRVVDYHGGTIDVDTSPGSGSRFVVILPAAEAAEAPGAGAANAA